MIRNILNSKSVTSRQISDSFFRGIRIVTLSFLRRIFLIVTDQPEITVHPKAETISERENLTLVCNATGNPAPTLSWTRDGSPVDTSGRISISDDKKQLTITNVSRTDSGEYRCVANNSLGNETSNVATLDVQCKYNVL